MQPKRITRWAYIPTSVDAAPSRWVLVYKRDVIFPKESTYKWVLVNKRGNITEMRGEEGSWISNAIPACYLDNSDNYEGDTND